MCGEVITGPLVVVVMIHLSLICSGLVWVVDSGDCSLIGVWVVVCVVGGYGDCESVVVRATRVRVGCGVGWVVVNESLVDALCQ